MPIVVPRMPGGPVTTQTEELAPFFERVDYPYFVVTALTEEGALGGCLAGFVTQCSVDPPNFLVCISKVNHTYAIAEGSAAMGLHLLGTDQEELARRFGEETGDRVDKFAGLDWAPGDTAHLCSPSRRSASKGSSSATSRSATMRLSCSVERGPSTAAMPASLHIALPRRSLRVTPCRVDRIG
jgi:flavin reductase (DIM6/NTAB) family NADH-FMN oxidoreductase RutF